jgi:hypothetical protein
MSRCHALPDCPTAIDHACYTEILSTARHGSGVDPDLCDFRGLTGDLVPDLTRRAFLVLGGATSAVIALPQAASARVGPRAQAAGAHRGLRARSNVLGRSDYGVALGKGFVAVGSDGQRYRLTLVAIRDVPHVRTSGEHAFNLLFKPTGAVVPDGIYRLASTHARSSDLFLSAVGPHGSGRLVQALIDRSS